MRAMVKAEADKIKNSVMEEFDDVKSIDIIHSTGIVNAGEISLLVSGLCRPQKTGNRGMQQDS